MIKTEKKKPFVLNREQHRYLKSLSKDGLMEWLRQFYCEVYNEAISETYLAVMRHLHDDNDWNNEQLEELFYNSNNDLIPMIAKELGVEVGEKFDLCNGMDSSIRMGCIYKFSNDCLLCAD